MNKEFFGTKCVCLARVSTSAQDYQAQINALHKKADEFGFRNTLHYKPNHKYDNK